MNAEALRRWMMSPLPYRAFLWRHIPLAAFAGLRVTELDGEHCVVRLPGGWRTRNPFRSTYFAAQAMAAELSTGAPALLAVRSAPRSISMLVRGIQGTFTKKAVGATFFTFSDVPAMQAAVARAGDSGDGETFVARSTGRLTDQSVVAEFEITWGFRRRA